MAAPEGYKALGKIGISYKGDYNPNTVYERLDAVYHNGSTYLAIKDAPDGAPRDDKINWIYLAKGYDGETVDVAESEIVFTESETRENIGSGEKVSTVFGKIKKFFTDLTAPAFAQMITTKEDLLATKVTGYVPDAKAVADTYTELNGKLLKVAFVSREVTVGTNNKATYGGYYAQGLTPKLDETGLNGTLLNIIVAYYGDKSDYHVNCNVKYFKGNPYFSVSSVLESRTILVVFALLYY